MMCSLGEDNLKYYLWKFENWMEGGLNCQGGFNRDGEDGRLIIFDQGCYIHEAENLFQHLLRERGYLEGKLHGGNREDYPGNTTQSNSAYWKPEFPG